MQTLSTFIKIWGSIPEVNKNLHWSIIRKILHIGKNPSKARSRWTSLFRFKYSLRYKGNCHSRKISQFFPWFKLGSSVSSFQTDTKLLHKYEHLFFLKTGNLVTNWVSLSLIYKHTVPERLSSQPNKIWNQWNFKNPNLPTL